MRAASFMLLEARHKCSGTCRLFGHAVCRDLFCLPGNLRRLAILSVKPVFADDDTSGTIVAYPSSSTSLGWTTSKAPSRPTGRLATADRRQGLRCARKRGLFTRVGRL